MRRLTLTAATIAALVVASTVVLVLQTRDMAGDVVVGRALDRARGLALAARAAAVDDGVVQRLARGLVDETVVRVCLYAADGRRLCDDPDPELPSMREAAMVARVRDSGAFAADHRGGLLGWSRLELWHPIQVGALAHEGVGRVAPGPSDAGRRVLLLVLDPGVARGLVRQALVHGALVTLLVVLLVGLVLRQVRLVARERDREASRIAELRFTELGRLSAVIAHEIRNPLGAIKGFAQFTMRRFAAEDPAHADLETIVSESSRLERLVQSLLLYARPQSVNRQPTDVASVVAQAARLVARNAADHHVELDLKLPDQPLMAELDGEQLGQAVLNVLLNGVEAMADTGGQLRVRLGRDERGLTIEVCDQGPGIAPDSRQDIVEPYVTSKARGTGLGLAVTARIVQAHGGTLAFSDATGGGARVVLRLPDAGGALAAERSSP